MTATEHTVCFTLYGSDFTRLTRDLFLSDEPTRAYRIITTGLIGADNVEKLAADVLDGTKRFTGSSSSKDGVGVADETSAKAKKYQKEARYVYAGRVKLNGKWYRPVAKGYNTRGDEIVQEIGKTEYIFEACGEPPHWWEPNRTAEAAVADAVSAGRSIKERATTYRVPVHDDEGAEEDEGDYVQEDEESDEVRKERLRLELAEDEAKYRAEDEAFEARITEYRKRILEQAHGDMLRLSWDGGHVDVPRAPFIRWAVERRKKLWDLAPPWESVCPTGMKLQMDSPYHSDWMIGAGLDLREDYKHNSPVQQAAIEKMFEIQKELGSFEVTVLVEGAGYAFGKTYHGKPGKKPPPGSIVILPNLSPKYVESVIGAAAVIAEAGGKTAHLAQVGLEHGLAIVVVPGAREKYPPGLSLTVNTKDGKVVLESGDEW